MKNKIISFLLVVLTIITCKNTNFTSAFMLSCSSLAIILILNVDKKLFE